MCYDIIYVDYSIQEKFMSISALFDMIQNNISLIIILIFAEEFLC